MAGFWVCISKENEQSLLIACERKRGVKGDYEVLGFSKNNHYIC